MLDKPERPEWFKGLGGKTLSRSHEPKRMDHVRPGAAALFVTVSSSGGS